MPKRPDETFTEYMARSRDEQPMVVRCLCGKELAGPAGEVREAMRAHREAEHPELPATTPKRNRKKAAICTTDGCRNPRAGKAGRYYGKCAGCCEGIRTALEEERELERARRQATRPRRRAERTAPRPAAQDRSRRRRGRPHTTPEWLPEARRLYEQEGLSALRIGQLKAAEWGYSSPASCAARVYEVFRREGVPIRSRQAAALLNPTSGGGPRGFMNPERLEVARVLHEKGLTMTQLGALAGPLWGYANQTSAAVGIAKAFRTAGIPPGRRDYATVPEVSRSEALALLAEAESKLVERSANIAIGEPGEKEGQVRDGNGAAGNDHEPEIGAEDVDGNARMLLDGLAVESLAELHRLVELGRTVEELGIRPGAPLS